MHESSVAKAGGILQEEKIVKWNENGDSRFRKLAFK